MKSNTLIIIMISFVIANSISSYIVVKNTGRHCHKNIAISKNLKEHSNSSLHEINSLLSEHNNVNNENNKMYKEIMLFVENNSEKIVASLTKGLKESEDREKKKIFNEAYPEYKKEIFSEKITTYIGKKNAKRNIAIFLDYSCGACKYIVNYPKEILKKFPDTQIKIIELSYFSGKYAESTYSVSKIISEHHHDKYQEFFEALLNNKGAADYQKNLEIAEEIGLKKEEIDEKIKNLNANSVKEGIQANHKIANALGINGTPSFIINDELIIGIIPLEDLLMKIDIDKNDSNNKKDD